MDCKTPSTESLTVAQTSKGDNESERGSAWWILGALQCLQPAVGWVMAGGECQSQATWRMERGLGRRNLLSDKINTHCHPGPWDVISAYRAKHVSEDAGTED